MHIMKCSFAVLILTGAALAQQATVQPTSQSVPKSETDIAKANDKQAREVVAKCIQALGGDAYLNINDIQQEGRGYGFYQNAPTGIGVPYWRFYRYPDKE